MNRPALASAVILGVLVLTGCGPFAFGDPLQAVVIENRTDVSVRVYQDGDSRKLPLDIATHETARTAFAWPIDVSDGRKRKILADDVNGRLVYCERFSYQDLIRVDWHISIEERDKC
jgi:hypothetical protein